MFPQGYTFWLAVLLVNLHFDMVEEVFRTRTNLTCDERIHLLPLFWRNNQISRLYQRAVSTT